MEDELYPEYIKDFLHLLPSHGPANIFFYEKTILIGHFGEGLIGLLLLYCCVPERWGLHRSGSLARVWKNLVP